MEYLGIAWNWFQANWHGIAAIVAIGFLANISTALDRIANELFRRRIDQR